MNMQRVGQRCTTDEAFTRMLCEKLEWPVPKRDPGETDDAFLARRMNDLKVYSPQWALVDLTALSHDELELAASQICNAAADYGQTQLAVQMKRQRQGPVDAG